MSGKIISLVSLGLAIVGLGAAWGPEPLASGSNPAPSHHSSNGFRNVYLEPDGWVWNFWRWRFGLAPREKPALLAEDVPEYRPRAVAPDLNRVHHPDPQTIQVTWIGHSTFLLQVAGLNILTDPIFSQRASPLGLVGPKRRVPPGLSLEELPPVHATVISHNHYDHLDRRTVVRLGHSVQFFVPLGLASWFHRNGLFRVQELDWWQTASFGAVRLHCVPAQHFSMRTLFDRNRTLWCGWVLETPAGRIYFTGDTGYCPHFKEIGNRLGPMRLSLIHIGGYQPRWFMRPMHANPEEAVRIHQDVGSRHSIGMHWGTFKLTEEPLGEPPLYLQEALKQAKIPETQFVVLQIGETRVFAGEP
ncbi:MAG: MBL fold metallo-hydrolase [Deltaproteobacteria bacterium]|nr:MBL fold metallo-hydrolase [Deltaproteobacteria bacterium]